MLRVEVLDDKCYGSSEVGVESVLIEIVHLGRLHCHHGGNDGAQELVNMLWQVWT